ncbi:unnamed protein product [Agarophyton chilense]
MDRGAITVHPLKQSQPDLYTGYYLNLRKTNETHINSALVISQTRFLSFGGYDKRIQTYEIMKMTYFSVARPPAQSDFRSIYEQQQGNPHLVPQNYIRLAVKILVIADEYTEIHRLSIPRRMNDDYDMAWCILQSLVLRPTKIFLKNMNRRKKSMGIDEVVDGDVRPPLVLIHVQNRLNNRLHSIGSGISYMERIGRKHVVIWKKDEQFGALYSKIYDDSNLKLLVMDELMPKWAFSGNIKYDIAWEYFD